MEVGIKVSKLNKNFADIKAVTDVSLEVTKGKVLGFLGPNAAGKTTTMRIITGYMKPDSGKVDICGLDMINNPLKAKEQIGYLPETGVIYPDMRAGEFLKFIAQIRKIDEKNIKNRIEFIVDNLSLNQVFNQRIDTLSKGYKRRLSLGQSLLHDPKVLILDEPTDGLDPNQKLQIYKLIKEVSKDKAIIISTHVLEEVELLCDYIAIIDRGKIVANGEISEVIKQHANSSIKNDNILSNLKGLASVFYNVTHKIS